MDKRYFAFLAKFVKWLTLNEQKVKFIKAFIIKCFYLIQSALKAFILAKNVTYYTYTLTDLKTKSANYN